MKYSFTHSTNIDWTWEIEYAHGQWPDNVWQYSSDHNLCNQPRQSWLVTDFQPPYSPSSFQLKTNYRRPNMLSKPTSSEAQLKSGFLRPTISHPSALKPVLSHSKGFPTSLFALFVLIWVVFMHFHEQILQTTLQNDPVRGWKRFHRKQKHWGSSMR